MENASKALIIAGAILLSILIIGLGMTIYQKAAGAMEGADLSGTAVQTYNAEFLNYEGTQTGANTRTLYQTLQSHNRNNQDDVSMQISCTVNDVAVARDTIAATAAAATPEEPADTAPNLSDLSKIKTGHTYYIYFTYSKAGYITHCYITRINS